MGNGLEKPLEGSRGSPVLTKGGEVVGLFRFVTSKGTNFLNPLDLSL